MNMNMISWISLLLAVCLANGCSKPPQGNDFTPGGVPGGGQASGWLVPIEEVFDGGPGKDGIPALDDPQFGELDEMPFLGPDALVVGIKVGDDIRAYPHVLLDWHEIVNDVVGGFPVAVTYCPLTGTAIGWNRTIDGKVTTFGVSGLLYNTNLIPYDRETDSNWSQMLLKSINGSRSGKEIQTYPVIETTWATWREWFPGSKVLTFETGFNRPYGRYPYGDYRENNTTFLFPVDKSDKRLTAKELGLGVITENGNRFYPYRRFEAEAIQVILDEFKGGTDVVVIGSKTKNILVAYERRMPDGKVLDFTAVQNEGPVVMQDQEGNRWTVFGEAVSGPRKGQQLKAPTSYIGMFFAWAAFYPGIDIYE